MVYYNPDGRRPFTQDVYLWVESSGSVMDLRRGDASGTGFREFLRRAGSTIFRERSLPYPNDFLLHYRIDNPKLIPYRRREESYSEFDARLLDSLRKERPLQQRRMYEVLYCLRKGKNPLHPDNAPHRLRELPGFRRAADSFAPEGMPCARTCYCAAETPRGYLLFDSTPAGKTALQAWKGALARRFFEPGPMPSFLTIRDVVVTPALKERANPPVAEDAPLDERCGLPDVPAQWYVPRTAFPAEDMRERYDLAPRAGNLLRLTGGQAGAALPGETIDMTCLEYLAGGGNEDLSPGGEWAERFRYRDRFREYERQLSGAGSPDERERILSEARVEALGILQRDFPQMRGLRPGPAPEPLRESARENIAHRRTI